MAAWSFTTEASGASTFAGGYDAEDRFRRFKWTSQSEDISIGNISNFKLNRVDGLRNYRDAHALTMVAGTAQQFDDDANLIRCHLMAMQRQAYSPHKPVNAYANLASLFDAPLNCWWQINKRAKKAWV